MDKIESYLNNDNIKDWLQKIGPTNSDKIKRKLESKNSNDDLNFHAVIDELSIGAFLAEFESVEYDSNINGKTPDWFIQNTNTIIEVRGINMIERDLIRDIFESRLKELIQKIRGEYSVSIEYDSESDASFFNKFCFEDFINKFSNWFSENSFTDKVFCYKEVRITILEQDSELQFLEVGIGNLNLIHIDKRKLKNIIDEKLNNYQKIVETGNREFIIAIVSDVKNGHRGIDLEILLYGPSVFNQNNNTKYSIMNGLYYNPTYKTYISGIIFMIRGQKPVFYKNYSNKNNRLSNILERYSAFLKT